MMDRIRLIDPSVSQKGRAPSGVSFPLLTAAVPAAGFGVAIAGLACVAEPVR
ncbi:hypothetical protein SAMN05444006_10361 [Allgaiera indica]|uniref:Uncharacterized protein n=1 Tax=Allgaiera indica TaxID=765699 RepID=A0A1H2T3C2_9RHOB|nr:hypothetical protein SAMN05444006_10361 [Allgaiera indica]